MPHRSTLPRRSWIAFAAALLLPAVGGHAQTAVAGGPGGQAPASAKPARPSPASSAPAEPARVRHPSLYDRTPLTSLPESVRLPRVGLHQGPWGVFNRDDGSPAGFGPVARYGTDRSAEDWTVLADPSRSDDVFDPLKFIPLNDSKSVYLTLSADERLRNWFETRPFLGTQKPGDSGRMTVRGLYGADLHVGPNLRFYGELVNGDAGGWAYYGYNATYRKRLDLEQGFAELTGTLLGARTGLKLGRQLFLDAPNYVLFVHDTPDVPQSWDGGRAYAIWPRVRLDLFDFVQTNTSPVQMFRDNQNWNARLWGAYESWAPPDFRLLGAAGHTFLDFFYYGYLVGGTPAAIPTASVGGTTSGSTLRNNYGTRYWGKAGPIEFSLGAIYQDGQFRQAKSALTQPVSAYSFNSFVGWRFLGVYGHPILGVQADDYSGGNDNRKRGTVGTYLTPYYPQSSYTDTTTYITEANLVDVIPTLEATLLPPVVARLRLPFYWRESTNDAVYGSGRIYSFRSNFHGGFIGATPTLTIATRLTRHLLWNNDIARFFASHSLQKAGASDGTYYQSTLEFRF